MISKIFLDLIFHESWKQTNKQNKYSDWKAPHVRFPIPKCQLSFWSLVLYSVPVRCFTELCRVCCCLFLLKSISCFRQSRQTVSPPAWGGLCGNFQKSSSTWTCPWFSVHSEAHSPQKNLAPYTAVCLCGWALTTPLTTTGAHKKGTRENTLPSV